MSVLPRCFSICNMHFVLYNTWPCCAPASPLSVLSSQSSPCSCSGKASPYSRSNARASPRGNREGSVVLGAKWGSQGSSGTVRAWRGSRQPEGKRANGGYRALVLQRDSCHTWQFQGQVLLVKSDQTTNKGGDSPPKTPRSFICNSSQNCNNGWHDGGFFAVHILNNADLQSPP